MEEVRSTPSPSTERKQEMSVISRIKQEILSFSASLQEGFRYVKAYFIGQAKKMTARNEKEATEADLQTAKMQVEAADDAEETKKKLEESM